MGNKLYVGNLAYSIRDEDLQQSFSQFGTVTSAKVMMDRDTGRSKGFGFVTFATDEQAARAKNELDGKIVDGRPIKVDFPREREDRGPRGGGFGGGGGGYDRGGYDRGDRRY